MKSQNFFSLIDDIFADRRSGWIIYLALNKQFAIKDLFSKCDQIRSFLWIWSLLLKSLMKNFIFCAVSLLAIHKIYSDFWNQVKIMSLAPEEFAPEYVPHSAVNVWYYRGWKIEIKSKGLKCSKIFFILLWTYFTSILILQNFGNTQIFFSQIQGWDERLSINFRFLLKKLFKGGKIYKKYLESIFLKF